MFRTELKKLFHFATAQTILCLMGTVTINLMGVTMSSPFWPVLANLYESPRENVVKWLWVPSGEIRCYVDDIFCLFEHNDHDLFHHDCIKFTCEEEDNSKLPFLDILISMLERGQFHLFYLTTYRKPMNTGLLTNFTSFCAYTYKVGLLKTLVD